MTKLDYKSSGEGIPLLLLHAFPLSSEMWKSEIKSLEKIVQVITPDLPGLGNSPGQVKPSIQQMAFELADFLDSIKVKEPIILAGLSMGGYVALEFIRQFPQRVRGLGLFSTRAGADSPEAQEKRLKTIEGIKKEGLEPLAASMLPNLIGKTTLETKPEIRREVSRMILKNKNDGIIAALLAIAKRRDSMESLGQIQCPTLIMAGREDALIPFSESEMMQKKIPGSQLHIFSQAGHLINLEQPGEFRDILEYFLYSKFKTNLKGKGNHENSNDDKYLYTHRGRA